MAIAVGIFDSSAAAERARARLVENGVAVQAIQMSVPLTSDDVAAEAPGQSYENQGIRDDAGEKATAQYGTSVRSGACTLSVAAASRSDFQRAQRLMQSEGARIVTRQP